MPRELIEPNKGDKRYVRRSKAAREITETIATLCTRLRSRSLFNAQDCLFVPSIQMSNCEQIAVSQNDSLAGG